MRDYARIARRITATLFVGQSLGRGAFVASGAVSAIAGAQLSGNPALAGAPGAAISLGAAIAALAIGAAMDLVGRRWGLALGLAVGTLGAGMGAGAIAGGAFPLLLIASGLMGVGMAATQLERFVAAEVHPPQTRGRAISNVVIGGTVGSVLGPLLVGPSGQWAQRAGIDALAGPYLLALAFLAVAAVVISIWLRPEPRDVGEEIVRLYPETVVHLGPARPVFQILRTHAASVAVLAMVVGQVVMSMVMGMTSLHMANHRYALTDISLVIATHTFGMFAFSAISGRLTDRWGRGPVILIGSAMLVLSCGLAAVAPGIWTLALALFLLGLGWNFCYVGGSTLLADQLAPAERARTQATNDLLIGLATASVSLLSGLVFAGMGFTSLAVIGVMISLVPLGVTAWWMVRRRRLAIA